MISRARERCLYCAYWDASTVAVADDELCACRRYPPTAAPGFTALCAYTSEHCWCGEFEKHDTTGRSKGGK